MWQLTPAARLVDLGAVHGRQVFFKGSVREVARLMPNNLNTSVGVALAGMGLDATEAELVADPAIGETAHELAEGRADRRDDDRAGTTLNLRGVGIVRPQS